MRSGFDRFHHCGPVGRLAPAVDQPNYRLAAWSPASVSSMQAAGAGGGSKSELHQLLTVASRTWLRIIKPKLDTCRDASAGLLGAFLCFCLTPESWPSEGVA